MLSALSFRRRFADLSEQEVLALAISSEEDDARIYRSFAERLRSDFPASSAVFDGMAAEEDGHRQRLIDLHRVRFGEVIPLIRREHVAGFYARRPVWLSQTLSLDTMRGESATMEKTAHDFYSRAAARNRMPRHGNFWAILPLPRPVTNAMRSGWRRRICPRTRGMPKIRPPDASSS